MQLATKPVIGVSPSAQVLREAMRGFVAAPPCEFQNGDVIFSEHERLEHAYLVDSGWVLLTSRRRGSFARRGSWWSKHLDVPVAVATAGALVGLIPLVGNELPLYSVVARGRCVCRMIDRALFQRVILNMEARLGSITRAILPAPALLGTSGRQCLLLGQELFLLEPAQRTEHLLWSLTQTLVRGESNKPVVLELPMTRDELGALVHMDGKTFTRVLAHLERQGIIRREKHAIVLLRRDSLMHIVGGTDPSGVF
jgi:CRP-like cAMP-binding protein